MSISLKYFAAAMVCSILSAAQASAQSADASTARTDVPQLVITANRIAVPVVEVGRSVEIRRQEEIEARQETTLPQVLQDTPGVRAPEIGGPGSPGVAPIEIRGFRTSGTQLLLNGLTLHDPSSVSGTFENYYPHIGTDALGSVELLKGGSSVLYGSDGQAGAINLITKSPEPGTFAEGSLSYGSYDTYRETGLVNLGNDSGGLLATASRTDSSGLGVHTDYQNTSAFALGEYEAASDALVVSPIFNLIQARNDLQTGPSIGPDLNFVPSEETERNFGEAQTYLVGTTVDAVVGNRSKAKGSVYYTNSDRRYFFDFSGFESRAHYEGSTFNVDLQNAFAVPEASSEVVGGMLYENQSTDTTSDGPTDSHSRDTIAAFLHNQWSVIPERLAIGGGGRVSHVSSISKTFGTLEGSGSLRVPETGSRIHTSVSQGFRSPTLFESSGTIVDYNTGDLLRVGNPGLDPEKTLSSDFGVEQEIFPGIVTADVTVFQIDADETIVYDFANNTHVNGGGGKTQGIESSLVVRPRHWLTLRGAYTNLDRADDLNGERRQRTPRNWLAVSALAEFERWKLSSGLRYRDTQELAFFGTPTRHTEGSAAVFDSAVSYEVAEDTELFLKGENIFDDNYTEAGYRMPGASAYGGIRFKLAKY